VTTYDIPVDITDRIRNAVDPLQVAAILESGGITDDVAKERFGASDIFTLGDQLYRSSGHPPPTLPPPSDRTKTLLADLLRGAIYAIPSLFFLASRRVVRHRHDVVILVIATVCSWATAQASSSIANGYLGRKNTAGAKRFLRRYLMGSIVAAGIAGVGLWQLTDIGPVFSAIAVIEVIYVASATALLLFDRDVLHVLSLAPSFVVTLVWLAGNPFGWSDRITLLFIALGLVCTVMAALATTGVTEGNDQHVRRLTGAEYRTAALLAIHGAVWALLLAALSLAFLVSGRSSFRSVVPEGVILPVVLSMGLAERSLRRFRNEARTRLHKTTARETWRRSVVSCLHRALGRYSVGLASLSAITVGVLAVQRRLTINAASLLTSFAILGAAFFLGLLAVALGQVRFVVLWSAFSGLVIISVLALTSSATATQTVWLLALGHLVLLVGLYGIARTVVVRVAVHH
jgi:hypothetical protein